MWVLLLLNFQNLRHVLVKVIRRLDRSSEIKDGLPSDVGFFVVVFDLNVNNMDRAIEIAAFAK